MNRRPIRLCLMLDALRAASPRVIPASVFARDLGVSTRQVKRDIRELARAYPVRPAHAAQLRTAGDRRPFERAAWWLDETRGAA